MVQWKSCCPLQASVCHRGRSSCADPKGRAKQPAQSWAPACCQSAICCCSWSGASRQHHQRRAHRRKTKRLGTQSTEAANQHAKYKTTHTHTKNRPDLAMDIPPQAHAASSSRSVKADSAAGPKFTKQQDRVQCTTAEGKLTGLGCLGPQIAAQSFFPSAAAPEILC